MFKVGDKVKVIDLEMEWYGNDSVVMDMMKFSGKEVTIKSIQPEFYGEYPHTDEDKSPNIEQYYLEEDPQEWGWTREMLNNGII